LAGGRGSGRPIGSGFGGFAKVEVDAEEDGAAVSFPVAVVVGVAEVEAVWAESEGGFSVGADVSVPLAVVSPSVAGGALLAQPIKPMSSVADIVFLSSIRFLPEVRPRYAAEARSVSPRGEATITQKARIAPCGG